MPFGPLEVTRLNLLRAKKTSGEKKQLDGIEWKCSNRCSGGLERLTGLKTDTKRSVKREATSRSLEKVSTP